MGIMKKIISMILIASILITPVLAVAENDVLTDDFDVSFVEASDTSVSHNFTISDALSILKHVIGMEMLPPAKVSLYDFRKTGVLNVGNALEVLKWLVWMPSEFGVNPNPQPPSQPRNFTATVSDRQVVLTWNAPATFGNGTFSHYEVSSNNGASWVKVASATRHTFTGLTNGTTYTFRVRAVSSAGNGSSASVQVTVGNVPTEPTNFNVVAGDKQATLTWSVPLNNGGAPILYYEVSNNNGSTWVRASSSGRHVFTGLTNGVSYTFAVRAVNGAGAGRFVRLSATPKAPPVTPPMTPQQLEAEVVRLTNVERVSRGLSPLMSNNERLTGAARKRAQEIITVFDHKRPDNRQWFTVLNEHAVAYSSAGENIAEGFTSAQAVVTAWLNSPLHRGNMLGSFTYIGVGVVEHNGTLYWVQLFITPL